MIDVDREEEQIWLSLLGQGEGHLVEVLPEVVIVVIDCGLAQHKVGLRIGGHASFEGRPLLLKRGDLLR